MVLAGGNDQAALIRELKQKFTDCFVVLVDMAKNVVAAKVADKHLVISTMDFDAVKQAAIDEKIDIILTACGDQPLLTMAIVSDEMGLPCYLTKEQVMNLTNKKFMKRLMVENGIPTSKYKTFDSVEDIDDSGLEYPLVVKPADSNGSKGVRKVMNREELMECAKISMKFSICHTIIVEEFNEGEDVSSDFYVFDGKVVPVLDCLSNKYKPDGEIAVIYQSVIPPAISEHVKDELQQIAEKIAKACGLTNTPLLIQTVIKGDQVRVVEFSARLGGGAKYQTIQHVTGFNVLRANMNSMLGEAPEVLINKSHKSCSRCHLYTTGGTFTGITGVEELLKEGIIEDFIQTRPFGMTVSAPTASCDRVASVFIAADSIEELKEKVQTAISRIAILDQDGKDMLHREMYAEPVKNAYGF